MFGSPHNFVHVVAWLCAAVLPEPIANRRIMALISFARRSHIVTELLDIRIAVAYTHSLSQTPVFIVTQFNIIMFAVFFCARARFADRLKLTLRLRLICRLRISLRLSIGFVGFSRKPLGFFKNRWVFSGFLFRPAALCTVYPVRTALKIFPTSSSEKSSSSLRRSVGKTKLVFFSVILTPSRMIKIV